MNPQALQCTLAIDDAHTARIVLSGDIVFENAEELLALVRDLLARDGVRRLRLDCAGVDFCDSYGLSTLLWVHREVTTAGGELVLENRGSFLDRLMRRTNTFHHLTGSAGQERREADS
ncbi:STAS domain-containing protein [Actinosynnema sp. NPDC023658]|uniref:STAS domain-containing protein n=1 Tax=Actinosynnema sp. NPDC023658 TaxID=3155465 RepID=UPI0033F9BB2A